MSEQTTATASSNRLPFSDQLPLEQQFAALKDLYFKIQRANDVNSREVERLTRQLDAHRHNRYDGHNVAERAGAQAAQWEAKANELQKKVAELEAEKAADQLPARIMELNSENAALKAKVKDVSKALNLFRELQRLAEACE